VNLSISSLNFGASVLASLVSQKVTVPEACWCPADTAAASAAVVAAAAGAQGERAGEAESGPAQPLGVHLRCLPSWSLVVANRRDEAALGCERGAHDVETAGIVQIFAP